MAQQSEFAALQSQLESAQLEVTAQHVDQGIVSAIDYQRSRLLADQLRVESQ